MTKDDRLTTLNAWLDEDNYPIISTAVLNAANGTLKVHNVAQSVGTPPQVPEVNQRFLIGILQNLQKEFPQTEGEIRSSQETDPDQ